MDHMLPARLVARCPSARVIGIAAAHDYDLEFSKRSQDSSGKATLVPSIEVVTPGVLFEIKMDELDALDRAEGAGFGYDRVQDFTVELRGSVEEITATTYIAGDTDRQLKPFDWYLALVIAGAQYNTLDDAHIQKLRLIQYTIDDNHTREGRRDALAALSSHEYQDHHALMRQPE